jgi:ABC-2 type transport system ATP-binding protein
MIELEGIAKTYADGMEALKGVSLRLGEGMFGLLGPNGAGKTTFLSILVLALEPSAGRRRYGGLDPAVRRERAEIRRAIGYLPQNYHPLGHLTGREYILHCARLRRVPLGGAALRARVAELLAAVGLERAADRRSGEYSGGMRRRLGIAQALVHAPRLLVVDEPTAGLDPEERIRFRELVTGFAARTTVLLSTHIVEDVEATCPRLGVIAGGRLLYDGPPGELLARATGRLWRLGEDSPLPPGTIEIARRVDPHRSEGGVERIVHHEGPLLGATPRTPTLEEAYASFLALRGAALPPQSEESAESAEEAR